MIYRRLGLVYSTSRGKIDTDAHTKAYPRDSFVSLGMGVVLYPPTEEYLLLFAHLGLVATLLSPVALIHSGSSNVKGGTIDKVFEQQIIPTINNTPMELRIQLRSKKVMPMSYWDDVAQCETRASERGWIDGGRFAGGLGIYVGAWKNYGGRQFASVPNKATREEQIVVANRIAVFGFQTKNEFMTLDDRLNKRPFFRPKVGYFGWGCIKQNKYLHPERWKQNRRAEKKVQSK